MKRYYTIIFIYLLGVFLVGCSYNYNTTDIRDYIVGSPYEIVSIDGEPPKRKKHGLIISYVPFVLVTQGKHVLLVKLNDIKNNQKNDELIALKVDIDIDKKYELVSNNGNPTLVVYTKQ